MIELLTFILTNLVSVTDKVAIEERQDGENSFLYLINVDPQDMGKVIGKEGKIIRAIRSVAKVWAVKHDCRVNIELVEETPRN